MDKHAWLSERMVFGLAIFCGYFSLATIAVLAPINPDARQSAKDALLVVGPLLGVIVQAIWKTDKVDRVTADAVAVLAAKAPDQSNAATVVAPAPATVTVEKQDETQ
jgi:hypothetical protein